MEDFIAPVSSYVRDIVHCWRMARANKTLQEKFSVRRRYRVHYLEPFSRMRHIPAIDAEDQKILQSTKHEERIVFVKKNVAMARGKREGEP